MDQLCDISSVKISSYVIISNKEALEDPSLLQMEKNIMLNVSDEDNLVSLCALFPGEWLLHPSGGVQGGQSWLPHAAQLPHVQDVLLSLRRDAGEELEASLGHRPPPSLPPSAMSWRCEVRLTERERGSTLDLKEFQLHGGRAHSGTRTSTTTNANTRSGREELADRSVENFGAAGCCWG